LIGYSTQSIVLSGGDWRMPVIEAFRLPDLGEGLAEGEIVKWLVTVGQTVAINQPIAEIETAKAVVELPARWGGRVTAILRQAGETVPVGTPIIEIETAGSREPEIATTGSLRRDGQDSAVLVGYGPGGVPTSRRAGQSTHRRRGPGSMAPAHGDRVPASDPGTVVRPQRVLAKPPVRKLARDLGVDLTVVTGTGPQGSITRDDVRTVGSLTRTDRSPRQRRVPVTGIRRQTAKNMTASAFTVPYATIFVTVDITRSLRMLERLRQVPAWKDVRVSPLLSVAKAVLATLPGHPFLNASWAESDIIVHENVDLGIAVATDRGLLVPTVKDAHRLSTIGLAREIHRVVGAARDGKATPKDLLGGTFSITNIGVFGVESGVPLVPVGQTAIVAMGAIREAPWVHNGKIEIREVVTLSLSFDHRVIDGSEGSGFLHDLANFLTDPAVFLLAWS
jgi:pyruvate dehydrogenase E2 component (dihydrolipoamide acetyltransferase)